MQSSPNVALVIVVTALVIVTALVVVALIVILASSTELCWYNYT